MPCGNIIYQLTQVEIIPFSQNELEEDIMKYVNGIKQHLEEQGFFYSYYADLSQNIQNFTMKMIEKQPGHILWYRDHMDERYVWNSNIISDFRVQKVDHIWTIPLVQGYIDQKTVDFEGKSLDIMLVSRRRCDRGGVRF